MADERDYDEELARIMNGLAESTLEISDAELDEELREEGDAPERVADEVRGVLRRAVKAHRQRDLIAAQKKYEERLLHLERKEYSLPDSAAGRRDLLVGLLAANSTVRSLLTAQHRDFTDLPDAEVTSYLKQLHELGALGAQAGGEEGEQ